MKEGAMHVVVGKPVWKRELGRHWSWWEDINKMDLKRNRMGGCGL